MPPAAPTYLYTSEAWMESLFSAEGIELRLDDDAGGTVSAAEQAYLDDVIIPSATDRVNFYCATRYAPIDLVDSNYIWHVCTVLACRMLAVRRVNPIPEPLEMLWLEAQEELKLIREGKAQVPLTKTRRELWPAWSNVEVDFRYFIRRIRVQRPISEKSRTEYQQHRSRHADFHVEI